MVLHAAHATAARGCQVGHCVHGTFLVLVTPRRSSARPPGEANSGASRSLFQCVHRLQRYAVICCVCQCFFPPLVWHQTFLHQQQKD